MGQLAMFGWQGYPGIEMAVINPQIPADAGRGFKSLGNVCPWPRNAVQDFRQIPLADPSRSGEFDLFCRLHGGKYNSEETQCPSEKNKKLPQYFLEVLEKVHNILFMINKKAEHKWSKRTPEEQAFLTGASYLMEQKGWGQKDLSEAAKISQPFISKVFAGKAFPSSYRRDDICRALGKTYKEVLEIGESALKHQVDLLSKLETDYLYTTKDGGYYQPEIQKEFKKALQDKEYIKASEVAVGVMRRLLYSEVPIKNFTWDEDGLATEIGEAEGPLLFKNDWIGNIGNSNAMFIMKVIGDELAPEIPNGAIVLVDTSMRKYAADRLYLFQQGERYFFRRFKPEEEENTVSIDVPDSVAADPEPPKVIGTCVWTAHELI